jgi:uncharacterized protein YraI
MKFGPFVCITATSLLTRFTQSGGAAGVGALSGANFNIRPGPSLLFLAVGVLGAGTRKTFHSCLNRYGWCGVSAPGLRGWVSGAHTMLERYFTIICILIASLGIVLSVLVSNTGTSAGWSSHLPFS